MMNGEQFQLLELVITLLVCLPTGVLGQNDTGSGSETMLPSVSSVLSTMEQTIASSTAMNSTSVIVPSSITTNSVQLSMTSSIPITSTSVTASAPVASIVTSVPVTQSTNTSITSVPVTQSTNASIVPSVVDTLVTSISVTQMPNISMTVAPVSQMPNISMATTTSPVSNAFISMAPDITSIATQTSETIVMKPTTTQLPSTTPQLTPAATNSSTMTPDFFASTNVIIAVSVGGFFLLVLVLMIFIWCCYCCCRVHKKRKDRYSVESLQRSDVIENPRYKPTISQPIPQGNWDTERGNLDRPIHTETVFSRERSVDHDYPSSQMQPSQGGFSQPAELLGNSLSKLTPFFPSQIMHQVGHRSVDDDLPERDPNPSASQLSVQDSPFIHLSNNLSGSTSSRLKLNSRSVDSPPELDIVNLVSQTDCNQTSQLSYLGLGVHHGSDLIITNTASLLDNDLGGIGLIGLDRSLGMSQDRQRHLHFNDHLDDKPDFMTNDRRSSLSRNSAQLTALDTAADMPVRDEPPYPSPSPVEPPDTVPMSGAHSAASSSRHASTSEANKKSRKNLSAMTSLTDLTKDSSRFTSSEQLIGGDLQERPERQRAETLPSNSSNFKRGVGKKSSKLGKLTSLEYIRNSLRKMRRKSSGGREGDRNSRKKQLKPALKPSGSSASNQSDASYQYNPNGGYGAPRRGVQPYSAHDYSDHQLMMGDPHIATAYPMEAYPPYPQDYYRGGGGGGGGGAGPYPVDLSQGYELSPILSVPFEYFDMPPDMIGLAPQYQLGDPAYLDSYQQYPELSPELKHDNGPSQRSVRWNLEPEEIPRTPVDPDELTPTEQDLG